MIHPTEKGLRETESPAPSHSLSRWATVALVLLVAVPTIFNAIALFPELSIPIPSLNDDAVHYLFIQRASEALAAGENVFDHWVPELELGFPQFLYYQHLPHLAVIFLHRLLMKQIGLFTLFNLTRYLLLLSFPLTVYWSMGRMGFSPVAKAVAAAFCTLLWSSASFGLEYGSYIWRGWGMYTQLWAAHLAFITLGCLDRLIHRGEGYGAAIVASAALGLSHLFYSYMMAPAALALILVGLNRKNVLPRVARLLITAVLAAIMTAYLWLPFIFLKAYLMASPYLPRWRYDSFGAGDILPRLINGDVLDAGRLPVLTLLLALGVASAVVARARHSRVALGLLLLWLALYFGRPTWGRLVDVLPMHEGLPFHRFIGGVHIAGILLIGLGGDWIWRQLDFLGERWRVLVGGLLLLILMVPALWEQRQYYANNTEWMERTKVALDTDEDARIMLSELRTLPPGRAFAGLRADWGKELKFGDLHFYDLLLFNRILAVVPPYGSTTLNGDLIWHFNGQNPAHYTLFNVRYVVAPSGLAMPAFLHRIKETPRYTLYQAETSGYAGFVTPTELKRLDSQVKLFDHNRNWLLSDAPAQNKYIRYDFPAKTAGPGAQPDEAASPSPPRPLCPDGGRIIEKRVSPARIDLQVECSGAAVIVLRMAYHPNWHVIIDGLEVRPFMLSPSLIGVDVPAGVHQIQAEYRSPRYKTALLLLGACTLLATIGFRRRLARLETIFSSKP